MKTEHVVVDARDAQLPGDLAVPAPAAGLVIFAHGSDSSRHSPRNKYVADVLNRAGIATLLFDLLSPAEARDRRNVFDIPLLAERLTAAHEWAAGVPAWTVSRSDTSARVQAAPPRCGRRAAVPTTCARWSPEADESTWPALDLPT